MHPLASHPPTTSQPQASSSPSPWARALEPSAWRYLYLRRVVGTALGALGLDAAMPLARRLARGLWELQGPARERAEQRIAAVRQTLGLPPGLPADLARACYEHTAAFWIETLFARRRLRPHNWPRCVRLEQETALRAACRADSPAIFVTAYLGHPGVGAFVLAQLCRPLHVLVDLLPHPLLRAWQDDLYNQPNLRIISRPQALTRLPAVLDAGGKVMLLGPQSRPDNRGDPVTFLGRQQHVFQTVRLLSARYGAPVFVFGCLRNSFRFDFTLRLAGSIDPAAPDLSQQTTHLLQSLILAHPQQYLWPLRY